MFKAFAFIITRDLNALKITSWLSYRIGSKFVTRITVF